jgi:hypothetical protein
MIKKVLQAATVLIMMSLAFSLSACGKGGDESTPPAGSGPGSETAQYTSKQVQNQPEATAKPAQPEATISGPSSAQAMTRETEDAMAESLTVDSDAPIYFLEEFDGEMNDVDWETMYSFWVDEEVGEDEPEAAPDFSIEQSRGVLRFDVNSPWLYLYRSYLPYTYQDIRIDMEAENKAANTNNISLFCRNTGHGWYEFIATSGGYYSIMRYYEDEPVELASGGIRSIKFGTDKKNVFTAICKGKTLTYIVNDVEIATVKDEGIPDAGLAGFNVSAEEVTPVEVEVNWIAFSDPE